MMSRTFFTPVLLRPIHSPPASLWRSIAICLWRDWRVDVPAGSPKVALFPRNGGFLFPERWLRQNGNLALFRRTMQPANGEARAQVSVNNYPGRQSTFDKNRSPV